VLDKNSSEKIRQRPGGKRKAEGRSTAQKKHQNERKARKTLAHEQQGKALYRGKEALHTTEQVTKKVSREHILWCYLKISDRQFQNCYWSDAYSLPIQLSETKTSLNNLESSSESRLPTLTTQRVVNGWEMDNGVRGFLEAC